MKVLEKTPSQTQADVNENTYMKKRSMMGETWHRLKKNKLAMVSLAVIIILVLCCAFANFIAPYEYDAVDFSCYMEYPSLKHLMGTDDYGRDIFSRILYGGRISLLVALCTVSVSILVSTILGATAGYFGGWYDNLIMRLTDVFMAIPGMLLAISVCAALGSGIVNTGIAMTICNIPSLTRVVRSSALLLKEQEYIEAAISFGSSRKHIIRKHIIPNVLAPIIVQSSLKLGDAILSIAGLSFIGLGIQPPTPEWGSMLNSGREFIRTFWPMITFPGIVIAVTMLAFNLLGDGLRDAMDPRLK